MAKRKSFKLRKGAEVCGYRIERRIGQGFEGEVYLAVEPKKRREVALKLIRLDDEDEARGIEFAVRTYRRLRRTRAVARLYRAGSWMSPCGRDVRVLAFEYLHGPTLKAHLDRWTPQAGFGERARLRLVIDLARMIARVHRIGLAAGDLYDGSNIIMAEPDGRPVLCDCHTGENCQPNRDYLSDLDELRHVAGLVFLYRKRTPTYKALDVLFDKHLRRPSTNRLLHRFLNDATRLAQA